MPWRPVVSWGNNHYPYIQAALDHLAEGLSDRPGDVARLTPLGHPAINSGSRYRTANRLPATGLRPRRID